MQILRKIAKKFWDELLNYGRSRTSSPSFFYFGLLKTIEHLGILRILGSSFSLSHFISSVSLPIDESDSIQKTDCSLLLVATEKDFQTLPIAIESVIQSQTTLNFLTVTIVVPEVHKASCESIVSSLSYRISVISEEQYFTGTETDLLQKQYGNRCGWVKQQLIKIRHICNTDSRYTLILDADTLLIRKRVWFDDSGKQILFQSEEFNQHYYGFLENFNFPNSKDHSFVTHYMLIDKTFMTSALEKMELYDVTTQIDKIYLHASPNVPSPFSIDFELYGQYLLSRNLCVLRKWNHRDINSKFLINNDIHSRKLANLSKKWTSVSAHTWRQFK